MGDLGHFRNRARPLPDLEQGGVPSFGGQRRRPSVCHLGPSLPGSGAVGVGGWRWCRGSFVPFLDFRIPDLDFRGHRRAMTRVAEPSSGAHTQCGTCLEPQQKGGHLITNMCVSMQWAVRRCGGMGAFWVLALHEIENAGLWHHDMWLEGAWGWRNFYL
jgi:hypothetical protein